MIDYCCDKLISVFRRSEWKKRNKSAKRQEFGLVVLLAVTFRVIPIVCVDAIQCVVTAERREVS